MAYETVLIGYDGLTGEQLFETIWIPEEVYVEPEPVGGGETTIVDNTSTEVG